MQPPVYLLRPDFMEYQPRFLDKGILNERLAEMASLGESVMYAGEGEPLLHADIAEIINHTKKTGIDVALTTNGVLLKKDLIDHTLGSIAWIKVSINGGAKRDLCQDPQNQPGQLWPGIGKYILRLANKARQGIPLRIRYADDPPA